MSQFTCLSRDFQTFASFRIASFPPRYELSDQLKSPMQGLYYKNELQKVPTVRKIDRKPYKAKRVLGSRKSRETGRKELLLLLEGKDVDRKHS